MLNVYCVKWGDKYSNKYVNVLKNMLDRHLTIPFEFHCVTDDPQGLTATAKLHEDIKDAPGWWQKPYIFSKPEEILLLDLDIVIMNELDSLIGYCRGKDNIVTIDDWRLDCYNTSVVYKPAYEGLDLWGEFQKNKKDIIDTFRSDQEWLTSAYPNADLFKPIDVISYRFSTISEQIDPKYAKIVCFHGDPKPPDCVPYQEWVRENWR